MLAFSHKFTFGLCISVIALTAVVVASVTLMIYKQQDNALLLQRINSLKAENAALREQVHHYKTTLNDTLPENLSRPAAISPASANSDKASDS
jgi:hypothetical protein